MHRLLVVLSLALLPATVFAQSAGGFSAGSSKEGGDYRTTITERSPMYTQDRVFAGSRMWLLDPGRYEVEVWYNDKFKRDKTQEGVLQVEIEIGLAPHLQLDIYQNLGFDQDGNWGSEGQQIELRYAFARHYNDIFLNPVLYLEWHPRHYDANRAEIRLLLGGDVMNAAIMYAVNLYFETNVDGFGQAGGPDRTWLQGGDIEIGATGAVSFGLLDNHLRIGAEIKAGVDQHGNDNNSEHFFPVCLVGPNVLLRAPEYGLKLTGTVFFGIAEEDPRVLPLVIAGWQF